MRWAEQALIWRWQRLLALTQRTWRSDPGQGFADGVWADLGLKYQDRARAGLTRGRYTNYACVACWRNRWDEA